MRNGITKWLVVAVMLLLLVGCEDEAPHFFGIPDHTWWQLSQHQREVVTANMTANNAKSVNRLCFSRCLQGCVPYDDSGSRGADPKCLGMCLTRCVPDSRFNAFYFDQKNQQFYPKLYDQYYQEHPNHLPLPKRSQQTYRPAAIKTKTLYAQVKPESKVTVKLKPKTVVKSEVKVVVAKKTPVKISQAKIVAKHKTKLQASKKSVIKTATAKKAMEHSEKWLPPLVMPSHKEKS